MSTLSDVAKMAGVGIMSVSRVVNGTRRVSPDVERRVREALAKIDYRPNEAARVLKGTKSTVLGLIVPDLADPFFAAYCSVIQEAAWAAGYMTLIASSASRVEREQRETSVMIQRRVAGLIVVPAGSQSDHFLVVKNSGIPLIAIDRPIERVESDSFLADNSEAASHATQHLIGHGHRNILCVATEDHLYTTRQRISGYSHAMRKAKLPPRVCLVGPASGSVADQISLLLRTDQAPTALFAASNHVGTEVLHLLQQLKIQVPQEVALICFDDFSAATLVSPPITVVQQPIVELGKRSAERMLERVKANVQIPPSNFILTAKLVIRKSCGC